MKIIKNKTDENIFEKLVSYLEHIDSKYHSHVLNGNYTSLAGWSVLQELLFYDKNIQTTLSSLILKYGLDFNLRTKKGVSFYHLYLIMLFYDESFRTEEKQNYFIWLLNFGILPNNLMIFNTSKIYSMLDMLYLLQHKKSMIAKSFFPSRYKSNYQKLEADYYNKLYLILICKNEKFYKVKIKDDIPNIHNITIQNIKFSNDEYSKILQEYILNLYNLPSSTDTNMMKKDILFLYNNVKIYNDWINERQLPLGSSENDTNFIFINPDFVNNAELQKETFLDPIENKFRFHQTFLAVLIRTKMNPYTRNKIDEKTLKEMIDNHILTKHIFPISSINDTIHKFPFIFDTLHITDTDIGIKNIICHIESFFNINHPYNQIHNLRLLKSYEIKYLSFTMVNETNIFPKFKECFENPNLKTLLKIMLHYCKTKNKFMNVIYFFLEEIFQDLQCYKRIKLYLDNFEENYENIVDIYFSRFQINNNHYLDKFMKNIYIIKDFDF